MLKRDGLRILTTGEISLAKELYSFTVRYNEVWVHHGSYLPFNLQNKDTAMTPNGEIWFETNVYRDDFSMNPVDYQHLFLHEMMHVWQHQRGMMVRMRGAFSWAADYSYDLAKNTLSDYSLEQQACIVSDYWLLTKHRFYNYEYCIKYRDYNPHENTRVLISKYKKILGCFPG